MQSRKELFEAAKAAVEKQEVKKNESQSYYMDCSFLPLNINEGKLVRLIGFPFYKSPQHRSKRLPFDPNIFYKTTILTDSGYTKNYYTPAFRDESGEISFILWKVYNKITEKQRIGNDWKPIYEDTPFYERVTRNNDKTKFKTGWFPSSFTSWNNLDLENIDWHIENNKSKVLAKRSFIKKDGTPGVNPEIPRVFDENIWRMVSDYCLDDVNLFIEQSITSDKKYLYKMCNAIKVPEEVHLRCTKGMDKERRVDKILGLINRPEVDELLKSIEFADLDLLYSPVSARQIYNDLKVFISEVDKHFHSKFYEELLILCEEEEKKYSLKKKPLTVYRSFQECENNTTLKASDNTPDKNPNNIEQVQSKRNVDDISIIEKEYPFYDKLPPEFKEKFQVINGEIAFKDSTIENCTECGYKSPDNFDICPHCGVSFVEDIPF